MKSFSYIEDIKSQDDFFNKMKTISELFMHQIETENLSEVTIFLIEAMNICINSYKIQKQPGFKIKS